MHNYWIRRYILFHNKRHPKDMGTPEIESFLTDLAVKQKFAASTQNQALHAVLFLYKEVLKQDSDLQVDAVRAKKSNLQPICSKMATTFAPFRNYSDTRT